MTKDRRIAAGAHRPRPGAEGEDRGRGSWRQVDGRAGRLDVIGSRLEPDWDHDGSPARRGLTDLFAVGGFDALTRLRHLGEDVLADRLARRLHDTGELGWAGGPLPSST